MASQLIIEKAGLAMSVQGKIMAGQRATGVPSAGPMEPILMALANHTLGNAYNAPAWEWAASPVIFRAQDGDVAIALSGAINAFVDDKAVQTLTPITLRPGQKLTIRPEKSGNMAYCAIAGGLAIAETLGGTSTYLAGNIGGIGRPISDGFSHDCRASNTQTTKNPPHIPDHAHPFFPNHHILRCVAGPEDAPSRLFKAAFQASARMSRMGLALEGPQLHCDRYDIISAAVFPGTVQLPASGQPFILGPDGQTTGGYARIAQIIRADLHILGRIRPGDNVRFANVTPTRARAITAEKQRQWRAIIPDFRFS